MLNIHIFNGDLVLTWNTWSLSVWGHRGNFVGHYFCKCCSLDILYLFYILGPFSVNPRLCWCESSSRSAGSNTQTGPSGTNNQAMLEVAEIIFPTHSDEHFYLHQLVFITFWRIGLLPCDWLSTCLCWQDFVLEDFSNVNLNKTKLQW